MAEYINKYANDAAIQAAVEGGELIKPYVAYDVAENRIDWNSKSIDYRSMPLTFEILSDGVVKWFYRSNSSGARTIEYKLNNGSWTSITSTSSGVLIPVVAGDTVQFRGDNVKYGDSLNSNVGSQFDTTCRYNVYGNIMSLINSTAFETLTNFQAGSAAHFLKLFANNAYLVSAQNLKLPALRLGQLTYFGMFYNCTSLTTAPESVGTSETVFDFTGIYNYTCREMFKGCTNLITAPALPALSLGQTCYESMFRDCTSLATAPELPATTLANYCYNEMFRNCTSLNYVKCLATDISASYCTASWLNGVSSTGTFVKKTGINWPSGASGIPSGWTVIEE